MAEAEINVAKITGAVPTRSSVGETDLGSIVAVYDYRAENGQAKFQKQRFEPKSSGKTFRTSHWEDGKLKPGIDRRGGRRRGGCYTTCPPWLRQIWSFSAKGRRTVRT
jgi:hypothetical protein